ncbi:hypothetical protein F5Y04DRAFT_286295 [Hypomontagnella monticulosa]|nr:hypothetical protein F5Y04DRAFT_286295 [Hypomontagnella monticulosa]
MEERNVTHEAEASKSPATEFAPPEYLAAQLRSDPPKDLPPEAIAALPHVPQFGSHFGIRLLTKKHIKLCEDIAIEKTGAVLHIPIRMPWPPLAPEPPGMPLLSPQTPALPFLWGYWVLGDKKAPIIKPKSRPPDEGCLGDQALIMPFRYANYSHGQLGPWQYEFTERGNLAKYLERRFIYDPASLECLYPREWTDPIAERHDANAASLPRFEDALINYHKRTSNGDLDDSFIDELYGMSIDHGSVTDMELVEGVDRLWESDDT